MTGAKHLHELVAFQFAEEFKAEVYALLERSPAALRDARFRSQLQDAVSGIERQIAEGFGRRNPTEFDNFVRYGIASLDEAVTTLHDGIHRGYFDAAACERPFTWGARCKVAMKNLRLSQLRLARLDREAARSKRQRRQRRP